MGRGNKKEAIASFHREQILKAAERLFTEKGYDQTTIADISKEAGYSRRTIYAYYESKEDMLHHIIETGLQALKEDIKNAMKGNDDFLGQYKAICMAMSRYQRECPYSAENVNRANTTNLDETDISDTVKRILLFGEEINRVLADFIEKGKKDGMVRQDTVPELTVYVLWSGITSLFSLVQTKGQYISGHYSISDKEFLEYGLKQLINSILEERI